MINVTIAAIVTSVCFRSTRAMVPMLRKSVLPCVELCSLLSSKLDVDESAVARAARDLHTSSATCPVHTKMRQSVVVRRNVTKYL